MLSGPSVPATPRASVVAVPTCPIRHSEYYFEDGNLVILVENTLFRLFRSTFTRHSVVFKDLFSLPTGPKGQPIEGDDDANPLTFSGISATDFERLLWVLYPPDFNTPKPTSAAEWHSILSLASRWELASVRALALRHLQSLSLPPVDRVLLAREFDLGGRWALAAYTALCERPQPLSLDEAARLGLPTATRVAQVREELQARKHSSAGKGGYHSLTRSAAARLGAGTGAGGGAGGTGRPPVRITGHGEGAHWSISKNYLAQGETPLAPARGVQPRKTTAKASPTAIPGTARLVAEAFGIDMGT
ncbi:hypothetical protein TRAPUB_9653 [Trametes pubescens]|uniref:BTB domain-containing protein n=1 Tax=Trametes pubescens TaxID=154538 RepID=A0A1M2W1X1_TRAPU|nr:hypothetical protein TRAPUB_9653 [Trametes pubescens]